MRLERLIELMETSSKEEPFILFAIAKEYENKGDNENSLLFYTKLVNNFPNYVGTYYHLGKHYEGIGNIEAAISSYITGMEVAKQQKDQHSYNELAAAKFNLTD